MLAARSRAYLLLSSAWFEKPCCETGSTLIASSAITICSEPKSKAEARPERHTTTERASASYNSWVNQTLEAAPILESHVGSTDHPDIGAACGVANAALPLSGPCPGRFRHRRRKPGHWTPMALACLGLRPRRLRATGQRRIRQPNESVVCCENWPIKN